MRLVAVAALVVALPSTARAEPPLRSGSITGWGYTFFAMFSGEARDCQWSEWDLAGVRGVNPECRVWLDSGCDPAWAGRDPAISASIQDISDLADGRTSRAFGWSNATPGGSGGVVVQLWRADCTEIEDAEWRSSQSPCCRTNAKRTAFVIPRQAQWMTVTTNDNHRVKWSLR